MSWAQEHSAKVKQLILEWLEHDYLKAAKVISSEGQLFTLDDINFQLEVIRKNIENGDLEKWVELSGIVERNHAIGKKVLCLHAGNLPLVGFQDVVAVLLSGADYYGKVSRKDPFLMDSLIKLAREKGFMQIKRWNSNLDDFAGIKADKVLFAGSEDSVGEVKERLHGLDAVHDQTKYLIRTAKMSVAWFDKHTNLDELAAAIQRYGGQGCRSVGVIVSPFALDEVKEELRKALDSFGKKYPELRAKVQLAEYRHAYNQALQRASLQVRSFVIEENEGLPDLDHGVFWVKGDASKLEEFNTQIQSIYSPNHESLATAQVPKLFWKPDGVDVLVELN